VELEIEKKMGKFISELIAWRLPSYIADISYGGIMKALLDFSFRFGDNPIGVVLDLPAQFPWYVFLFSESQPRYLLTLPESSFDDFSFLAEQNEIPYTICGRVYGDSIIIKDLAVLEKEKLKNSYLSCIYRIMGG
ncbi:MAG: AIR synthase-related protein, partial [bacterium]